jgi:hypothetical protein
MQKADSVTDATQPGRKITLAIHTHPTIIMSHNISGTTGNSPCTDDDDFFLLSSFFFLLSSFFFLLSSFFFLLSSFFFLLSSFVFR